MADDRKSLMIGDKYHARARAAVRLLRAAGHEEYTLSQFTEEAFEAHLRRIAEDYNDGRPIHADSEPLRPGRP